MGVKMIVRAAVLSVAMPKSPLMAIEKSPLMAR